MISQMKIGFVMASLVAANGGRIGQDELVQDYSVANLIKDLKIAEQIEQLQDMVEDDTEKIEEKEAERDWMLEEIEECHAKREEMERRIAVLEEERINEAQYIKTLEEARSHKQNKLNAYDHFIHRFEHHAVDHAKVMNSYKPKNFRPGKMVNKMLGKHKSEKQLSKEKYKQLEDDIRLLFRTNAIDVRKQFNGRTFRPVPKALAPEREEIEQSDRRDARAQNPGQREPSMSKWEKRRARKNTTRKRNDSIENARSARELEQAYYNSKTNNKHQMRRERRTFRRNGSARMGSAGRHQSGESNDRSSTDTMMNIRSDIDLYK